MYSKRKKQELSRGKGQNCTEQETKTPRSSQIEKKQQFKCNYRQEQRVNISCQKEQAIHKKDRKRKHVQGTPELPSHQFMVS